MSSAPVRGIVPHRHRSQHQQYHAKHQRRHNSVYNQDGSSQIPVQESIQNIIKNNDCSKNEEIPEKRPKVNPIFLWAAQREQRIVEVRCEDYDKRNRIKLTKTAQGWRSIPRTALTTYPIAGSIREDAKDQEKNLKTISKNEEKENTSREQLKINHLRVDELEATRIINKSYKNEIQQKRGHKRKRKKHSEISKNKKNRIDLNTEEVSKETLITINWKMKKRRKLNKNKKRKKVCLEDKIFKKKINNQSKIKIKEEPKKEVSNIEKVTRIEELNVLEEYKKCNNKSENIITLVNDHKKYTDLEKLQKNRHFQPRVVLEQLHLSQLPSRIHRRQANRTQSEDDTEQNEVSSVNNVDKIIEDNVQNNNKKNNESQVNLENENTLLDKKDWLIMLNILDSNHVSININENKSNLIESRTLTKICTKIDSVLTTNETNDNKFKLSSKEYIKNEYKLISSKTRTKFEQRENIKHRIGSKSLDETIERLERSINNNKKISSVPSILTIPECKFNKQKFNKMKSSTKNKIFNLQNSTNQRDSVKISEGTIKKINIEEDIIQSSETLNALKNTLGLSISLDKNDIKHDNFINTILNTKKILSSSISPDSQTEVIERIGNSISEISVLIPTYHNQCKTESPILKNRIESPESTVNFTKNKRHSEVDTCEIENQDSVSLINNEIKNQNNDEKQNFKYIYQKHEDSHKYFDDEDKNYSSDSKVPNLKPLTQLVSRNSEAQAKNSSLLQYQEIGNFDEQIIEGFHSQVSPQSNKIMDPKTSLKRSSSIYLERLLPSPPCSVSCSDDAKNDLTLKGILSSPNNIDSKNQDKQELINDLSNYYDFEANKSYNILDEKFIKESSIINKTIINHKSERYLEEKVKYLEIKNHERPISCGELQNPFVRNYISPKCPLSTEWTVNQQRIQTSSGYFSNNMHYVSQEEFISKPKFEEMYASSTIFLDPASQLRELIKTSGHLIPDPLLVPRDYLPFLAGAPLTEIPKLLSTRPELRLPEALTRPELLMDPDLLVISLEHLQYVLDHGEKSIGKSHQSNQILLSTIHMNKSVEPVQEIKREQQRPKLICKPIGKLMPTPIDLSNNQKLNSNPPLLRVRSGLLKQESEVSSTANSPEDFQLWHPLFGSQKQRQQQQPEQHSQQQHPISWHRTTLAS